MEIRGGDMPGSRPPTRVVVEATTDVIAPDGSLIPCVVVRLQTLGDLGLAAELYAEGFHVAVDRDRVAHKERIEIEPNLERLASTDDGSLVLADNGLAIAAHPWRPPPGHGDDGAGVREPRKPTPTIGRESAARPEEG
jgi:hypothetical protein